MYATYVSITVLATVMFGGTAVANLVKHSYPVSQADLNQLPRSLVRPLGAILGVGTVGLVAGFAVPALGTLASFGFVLYFVCAFGAHVRSRNYQLGPWAVFFALSVATLTIHLIYRGW